MAELNVSQATTTDLKGNVKDFSVNKEVPDSFANQPETYWDFPDSSEYLGYYKAIPELKKAIDALAIWTVGKGVETDHRTKAILERINGFGKETFQNVMFNMIVCKKIFGDSFAEIILDDDGEVLNLKPLYTGNMRVVQNDKGIIIRYEHRVNEQSEAKRFTPEQILHLSNDRIANEIHGTSVIESCKWVIDARNEALRDERMIKHRELALGILYVDTDNTAKLNTIKTQYANAIKNGEVLVLPKDTAELKDSGVKPQDRIAWIQYLENFFYQAVGVPRVIATSENFTEAASKVGYITFEPIYTSEQTQLEADMYEQLALTIKFNRPPSLTGVVSESEQKNTGQLGIQPNEVTATANRVE